MYEIICYKKYIIVLSDTRDTAGVSVGDTCRRPEIVDFVERTNGNIIETKKKLRDKIYTYAGEGKWEDRFYEGTFAAGIQDAGC